MTQHLATVHWQRDAAEPFTDHRYHRRHEWAFDGGARVAGSSSPHVVRLPFSDATAVDPEEAFVAALASCHLLWFLDFAARAGLVVEAYDDEATGEMGRDAEGREVVARVTLRPRVRFATAVDEATHVRLHHDAHASCFIANSVRSELRCEPTLA